MRSRLADALYQQLVVRTVPVSSAATAEAVKLTENIFRAVNIALVNELKVVYAAMGIDIWEVIDAAKTKPFGFMPFYPGPGLGGHCIPIDPFYLTWKAREYDIATRFIELAGEINTRMPLPCRGPARRSASTGGAGAAFAGSKILLLGIAYKKNVDDMRESPSLKLIELIEARGAHVDYHDPFIPVIPPTREHAVLGGPALGRRRCRDAFALRRRSHRHRSRRGRLRRARRRRQGRRRHAQRLRQGRRRGRPRRQGLIGGIDAREEGAGTQAMTDDVRVAVVGCGYWGKNLVRNFAELGALEALVDAHRPTVDALDRQARRPRARTSRKRSLTPTVDAVAIAAPAALHHALGEAGARGGQARLRREAARPRTRRGRGALRPRRAPRPAPHGRASAAISPRRSSSCKTLVRDGRARAAAIHLFEPAEPRQDPARGGHPLVLRAARPLDDPVARRRGARQGRGSRRLLSARVDRRRDDDAPCLSGRRAGARFRLVAAPVQGTEARRRRHRTRWRCSTTASPGSASCCSIRTASSGRTTCRFP